MIFKVFLQKTIDKNRCNQAMDVYEMNLAEIPYARDKTAFGLFTFSRFCLWSIREGVLFKRAVYLVNLPAGKLFLKRKRTFP